jgi:L-asparaginase/Glu-tRNA(Gln) amidotransferase subunit D
MDSKIVVISTGGTIASRFDHAQERVVAVQRGEDLVQMVPQAKGIADIEVENFCNKSSKSGSISSCWF